MPVDRSFGAGYAYEAFKDSTKGLWFVPKFARGRAGVPVRCLPTPGEDPLAGIVPMIEEPPLDLTEMLAVFQGPNALANAEFAARLHQAIPTMLGQMRHLSVRHREQQKEINLLRAWIDEVAVTLLDHERRKISGDDALQVLAKHLENVPKEV